jgi:hypothetical protein
VDEPAVGSSDEDESSDGSSSDEKEMLAALARADEEDDQEEEDFTDESRPDSGLNEPFVVQRGSVFLPRKVKDSIWDIVQVASVPEIT